MEKRSEAQYDTIPSTTLLKRTISLKGVFAIFLLSSIGMFVASSATRTMDMQGTVGILGITVIERRGFPYIFYERRLSCFVSMGETQRAEIATLGIATLDIDKIQKKLLDRSDKYSVQVDVSLLKGLLDVLFSIAISTLLWFLSSLAFWFYRRSKVGSKAISPTQTP